MNLDFKRCDRWLCCVSVHSKRRLQESNRSRYGSDQKKNLESELTKGLSLIKQLKDCIYFDRLYQEGQKMLKHTGIYYDKYESKQIECSNKTNPKSILIVKEAISKKWNGFELRMEKLIKLYKTNNLEIDSIMQSQLTHLVKEMREINSSIINRGFIDKIERFKMMLVMI